MSYVYFIQQGQRGPIKIGFAANPVLRLGELQVSNPNDLRIVGVLPGQRSDERAYHKQFAHLRIRGEWFLHRNAMRKVLDAAEQGWREYQAARAIQETNEVLASLGLPPIGGA